MTSWLDSLPPSARERLKEKYKMSASAYEKLREKVKGPEDLEHEMAWNEIMAQLRFDCETEPAFKAALQDKLASDISEHGIEAVLDTTEITDTQRQQLEAGRFVLEVGDLVTLAPEGNISESLPVKRELVESYCKG